MGVVYEIRKAVALIILFSGLVVLATGIMMTLAPANLKNMSLFGIPRFGRELHKYTAFVLAGASVVHAYLNWPSIKRYLGFS